MNLNDYQSLAQRTAMEMNSSVLERFMIFTELCEYLDVATELAKKLDKVKRKVFYNSEKLEAVGVVKVDDVSGNMLKFIHGLTIVLGEVEELRTGKDDSLNLKEELGDMLWGLNEMVTASGYTLEEVAEANIRKLSARYPDKYSDEQALNRDLDKEKEALK